ncbi:MAG: DUF916 and DUF3324 domain-containing protein [Cetobacterium sp.]
MKKRQLWYLTAFISLFIFSTLFNGVKVLAANENSGMSFNLDATISDKHRKKGENESYFDLLMKPGESTDLKVTVLSSSNATQKIKVTPSNSYTSQTGLVDYTTDDKKLDKTLKHPMTTLVSEAQTVELKPNEKKELTFKLTMPKEDVKGVLVGGLVAETVDDKKDSDKKEKSQGVKITNKFQVIKPIVLRQNEETVKTELKLNDVKPALVGYRTAVTANIQNETPTMFGKLNVVAKITKKGSTEVLKKTEKKDMEMAPNSNFDFPISWNDQPLEPGDYTLDMVATSGEREWPFKKDFKITKEDSEKLNEEAVDLPEKESLPIWIWILIGSLVGVILIILIVVLVKHNKKKKKEKERKASKKSSSSKGTKKKSSKSSSSKSKSKKNKSSSSKKK